MTNPDRVAFTLFGHDIYWYGVLMAIGILVGAWLADREGKRKGLPEDSILDMLLIIIPCGIVSARLFYVLFEWKSYAADPIRALYVWEGGLAIYGAVIGGLLGLAVYTHKKHIRFLKMADCIAPGLVLAQSIGRWGNFFNQEAFGKPIVNGELIWFPFAVRIDGYHTFNGIPCDNPYHMATFFYESAWCLIVFIVLWLNRKKFKHDGDAILTYAMLYGFERMIVEGLRGDSLYLIQPGGAIAGGVRVSQLISFVVVAAVIVFFIIRARREKRLGMLIWPAPEVFAEGGAADAANAPEAEEHEEQQEQDCGGAQDDAGETQDDENK